MNLSNLTNEQIHKVKDFYQQAVIKYENLMLQNVLKFDKKFLKK